MSVTDTGPLPSSTGTVNGGNATLGSGKVTPPARCESKSGLGIRWLPDADARFLNHDHFYPGKREALLGWLLRADHQFNMGWISTPKEKSPKSKQVAYHIQSSSLGLIIR